MTRVRFKVPTWEEGKKLIAVMSNVLNVESKEEDEYIVVESDGYRISMMPDDRGFSFFMINYSEESVINKLNPLIEKYRS